MRGLLECPFCGKAPHISDHHHDTAGWYWVICCNDPNCAEVCVDKPTKDEAITAWNTRATPPAAAPDEAMVRDAMRYRWLRDPANEDAVSALISIYNYGAEAELTYSGDELDGVIDAARTAALTGEKA